MQVVFTQNVANIAKRGEAKDVKEGYAVNYLFPQGLAVRFSEFNKAKYTQPTVKEKARGQKKFAEPNKVAHQIRSINLNFSEKADDKGTFFAGVTKDKISAELQKHNIHIKAKNILLDEPIKHAGDFKVSVEVAPGMVSVLTVKTKNT